MAEKQKYACRYCKTEYPHTEYIIHQLHPSHSKRIKVELLHCEFSAVCLVCILGLGGLNEVESHVRAQKHKDNHSSHLSNNHTNSGKRVCGACGVAFYNELALEAHFLMPSHEDATSQPFDEITRKAYPLLPNVNEVFKQLSGLPGEHFTSADVSCVCGPCDLPHNTLEDLILHMFASTHISRLKLSKCIVCNKEFSHPVNCNDHLGSSKHRSAMQKMSKCLEQWRTHRRLTEGGFSCVFCMLWCSSWHGMKLHLCSAEHTKAHFRSEAKQCGLSRERVMHASSSLDDCHGKFCDAAALRNWREWRENELQQQAWCYRCGSPVSSLDLGSKHLREEHQLSKSEHGGGPWSAHLLEANEEAIDLSLLPGIYDCCVCALSFKSAPLLSAHEASFEHHCKLEVGPSSNGLQYCANCGVVLRQRHGDEELGDAHVHRQDEARSIAIGNRLHSEELHADEVAKAQAFLIQRDENFNNDDDVEANILGCVQSPTIAIQNADFQSPIVVAAGIASIHSLPKALDTMMAKVSEALLGAFIHTEPSTQPHTSKSLKRRSADYEMTRHNAAKRNCDFDQSLHPSTSLALTPLAHEDLQALRTTGFGNNDVNQTKAFLLLSTSVLPPYLSNSTDLDGQVMVLESSSKQTVNFSCNPPQALAEEQDLRSSCEKLYSQHQLEKTSMMGNAVVRVPKFEGATTRPALGHIDERDIGDDCWPIMDDLKDTSDWWRLVSDLEDSSDSEMQI